MSDLQQTAPGVAFDTYAEQGVLAYQWCGDCQGAVFPPRVLCPSCGTSSLEWRASEGRGTVYSCTTITPRDGEPYTIALVDVAEGYRMMSTVTDPHGGSVAIGDPVVVAFDRSGDASLPVFVKDGAP